MELINAGSVAVDKSTSVTASKFAPNKMDKYAAEVMQEVKAAAEELEDKELPSIIALSPQHQRLVHLFLTGQYTTSKLAELFDVHTNTVLNWLKRDDVRKAIAEVQLVNHEVVNNTINALTVKAVAKLGNLIQSPIDAVALSAVKDVLDRTGHKPKQEIKVEKTVYTFEQKIADIIDATIDDTEFEEIE